MWPSWTFEVGSLVGYTHMAVVVKTNGIPFWGRCTTHFRTYVGGDLDVRYGILTHGHLCVSFMFGVLLL